MQTASAWDRGYEWRAVALLSIGFGLVGIDRFMIAPMFPSIMRDLHLSYQDLGNITAALSIAWGISALFMGRLSDRIGRRKVIVGSLLMFSVLIGASGLATGVLGLIVVRAMMGLADGAYTPTSISATIDASSPARHGLNIGIQQAMLPLFGLAIAPLLVTSLLQAMSWRWVFPLLTIPGLIVATLMVVFLRDQKAGNQKAGERSEASHDAASWRTVLRQRNIPILMVGMLCWLTCLVVTSAMFPSFLVDYLHLSLPQMGHVMSAIGFGAAAGCLVLPALSDRLGRKPVMVAATVGACLSIYALSQTGADPARLFVFLFLTHFFNFALLTLTVGPVSVESVPPAAMATASGVVICVGELFGGGLAPILAGTVAQRFGIEHVLGLAMGGLAIGFVAMLFLKETAPGSWRRRPISATAVEPAGM